MERTIIILLMYCNIKSHDSHGRSNFINTPTVISVPNGSTLRPHNDGYLLSSFYLLRATMNTYENPHVQVTEDGLKTYSYHSQYCEASSKTKQNSEQERTHCFFLLLKESFLQIKVVSKVQDTMKILHRHFSYST